MDSTPSRFSPGYRHLNEVPCPSCEIDPDCRVCKGNGSLLRGCGGPAEMDEHYGLAYCPRCGHMVDSAELSTADT